MVHKSRVMYAECVQRSPGYVYSAGLPHQFKRLILLAQFLYYLLPATSDGLVLRPEEEEEELRRSWIIIFLLIFIFLMFKLNLAAVVAM